MFGFWENRKGRPDGRKSTTIRRSCVRHSLRSPQDQTAENRRRPGALVSGTASAAPKTRPQKIDDDPALLCPAQPPQPPRPDRRKAKTTRRSCLRDMTAAGRGTYFRFVLHRLREDRFQYRAALDKLLDHFVLSVSAWSQAVPAPLGKLNLFKVTGGTGLGAEAFVTQALVFAAGVFRNNGQEARGAWMPSKFSHMYVLFL